MAFGRDTRSIDLAIKKTRLPETCGISHKDANEVP